MAIVKELYAERADGVKLYRTYSDLGYKIRKVGTDEVYSEAVDVETASYEYEETDKKTSEVNSAAFEAGKKAERDAFWEVFQRGGTRTFYVYGFRGDYFDFDNFYPKYDIAPTADATQIFYNWSLGNCSGSLKQRLEECDVKLDTSKCASLLNAFSYTHITEIPTIDVSGITASNGLHGTFSSAWERLVTIEKIIVAETSPFLVTTFQQCTGLTNVIFEGVIGQNGLNLQWSTQLSHDSLLSILNCLSATTSGLTVTLSKEAVNKAFATSQGATDGSTSTEWLTLIATKSNWTISLV